MSWSVAGRPFFAASACIPSSPSQISRTSISWSPSYVRRVSKTRSFRRSAGILRAAQFMARMLDAPMPRRSSARAISEPDVSGEAAICSMASISATMGSPIGMPAFPGSTRTPRACSASANLLHAALVLQSTATSGFAVPSCIIPLMAAATNSRSVASSAAIAATMSGLDGAPARVSACVRSSTPSAASSMPTGPSPAVVRPSGPPAGGTAGSVPCCLRSSATARTLSEQRWFFFRSILVQPGYRPSKSSNMEEYAP